MPRVEFVRHDSKITHEELMQQPHSGQLISLAAMFDDYMPDDYNPDELLSFKVLPQSRELLHKVCPVDGLQVKDVQFVSTLHTNTRIRHRIIDLLAYAYIVPMTHAIHLHDELMVHSRCLRAARLDILGNLLQFPDVRPVGIPRRLQHRDACGGIL